MNSSMLCPYDIPMCLGAYYLAPMRMCELSIFKMLVFHPDSLARGDKMVHAINKEGGGG